jgi:hypothetical protein
VLGGVSMSTGTGVRRFIEAVATTLIGTAFFFLIVGVFGLPAAIGAGILFVALALSIFRRPQTEGMR